MPGNPVLAPFKATNKVRHPSVYSVCGVCGDEALLPSSGLRAEQPERMTWLKHLVENIKPHVCRNFARLILLLDISSRVPSIKAANLKLHLT